MVKIVNFMLYICIYFTTILKKRRKTKAQYLGNFSKAAQWLGVPGEANKEPEERGLLPLQVPGALAQPVTSSPAEDSMAGSEQVFLLL